MSDDEQFLLDEATRLSGEAEAVVAMFEAKGRLRRTQESNGVAQTANAKQEIIDIEKSLEQVRVQLRKAKAFCLPEKDNLQCKVNKLEQLQAQLDAGSSDSATVVAPDGRVQSSDITQKKENAVEAACVKEEASRFVATAAVFLLLPLLLLLIPGSPLIGSHY